MIEYLKARGWTGIKRGTGLDEIEIDFRGREGLIALDGKNGAGKSSTLELLHMFDCLVSRDTPLYQNTLLRDSVKELSFTHNGKHYRTVLKIDSQSKKSEGYAYIDGSSSSVVKGKISEYHKWAVETFGSPDLFFASLFCGQNGKKFSDMRVGELKALFAEFLRLERYEAWADTSKQAGNILAGKIEGLDARIRELQNIAAEKADIDTRYLSTGERLEFLRDDMTGLRNELQGKRAEIDALQEAIRQNALAVQKRDDLQSRIAQMEKDLARERSATQQEIEALTQKYRDIRKAIEEADAILINRDLIEGAAEKERAARERLEKLQADIEATAAKVAAGKETLHGLETSLAENRQKLKDLDLERDPENARLGKLIEEAERAAKDMEKDLHDLDNSRELFNLNAQMENCRLLAKDLEKRDPSCQSETCSFIVRAIDAADQMIPLGKRRAEIEAEIEAKKKEITGEIERIKEEAGTVLSQKGERVAYLKKETAWSSDYARKLETEIKGVRETIRLSEASLKASQELADSEKQSAAKLASLSVRLPEIRVAEARKTGLEQQIQEITAQGMERKRVWQEAEVAKNGQIAGLIAEMATIRIDDTASVSLSAAQGRIKEIESVMIPELEKKTQAARENMAAIQAELRRIGEAEKEMESVRAQRNEVAAQVARWRYLQTACGKNGIQALEIDGAAPLISAVANDLLMKGYGPQFTVRIDTQDEQGREDLDIKVLSEWGEDSLKLKSGGERVWLLHPIRLAMILLNKEKGGRDWDMAFFDEITGALDSKGASENFMSMYRPFMEAGNIKQIFYITHQDECLAYADHKLLFQEGQNPFWA